MDWLSLLLTAVSGTLGVIGVFVGAYMARKTAVEQQRHIELHSACSLVLSTYARWVEDPQEYRFALLASIASAQLLCTPDSDIDKSIAGQKSVLSLIWQYWCAEMHGDANPCTLLKLPQGLPQTKRRAPTEREVADVKAHPEGFGLCPAIMMYAGLRLGEVMALQKKDLADGAIRVRKAVVWHNNYPELEEPKTDSAYRTVPILKPLQDALGSRLADLADDDFIFGGKKPMTKSRYQNAWLQYCIGIGHAHDSGKRYKTGKKSKDGAPLYKTIMEPDFTAHQLRHEFASTLVQCGISPQVAKELMGHADILTTQRWYAEAKASAVDEATRILNAHFTA